MKKLLILTLLMPVVAFAQVREDGSFRTILRGTVTDSYGSKLYIKQSRNDDREKDDKFIIPIIDGKFEYILEGDYVREYIMYPYLDLWIGNISNFNFFPDAEVIEFIIIMGNKWDCTVSGGEINRSMNEHRAEQKRLFEERQIALHNERDYLWNNKLYYNDKFYDVIRQMGKLQVEEKEFWRRYHLLSKKLNVLVKERACYTSQGLDLLERTDALKKEMMKWQYEYMITNPDLFSLSLLINDITSYRDNSMVYDISDMERAFSALSAANPNHPYTLMVADGINALKNLIPGAMFIDFTAPTLDGTMHTLSEEIKGKIAVIDLWASWCTPCRNSSKEIIPIYEKYKNRGFTVVGVAHEFQKADWHRFALHQDGYPWLNLLELDDRAGIWMKYGAGNAGGRKILVDENGKIVKLDVTAEEIAEYLSSRLD